MRKSRFILMSVAIVLSVLCMGANIVSAAPTVHDGFEATATIKGEARFRNMSAASLGGGQEIYVGLPSFSAYSTNNNVVWAATNKIIFSYDGTILKARVEPSGGGTAQQTTYSIGALGTMNYIRVDVVASSGNSLSLTNVKVNGEAVTGTFSAGGPGSSQTKNIRNVSLTGSFTIEGDLARSGTFGGGDSAYLNLAVGYFLSDTEGPKVTSVLISPNPQFLNGPVVVTATIDDTDTGGSKIQYAEYKLNGGSWTPMDAVDGFFFDDVIEEVTAGFKATQIGTNTVCVKGADVEGNVGLAVCKDIKVIYKFVGFFMPIENDALNLVKAGQGIPAKWMLTDYNNYPISDPASYEGLFSYEIACDTLAGDPTLAVEEVASGNSGLQYIGDGYWQLNWKTPKSYADKCQAMYVEFNCDDISPVVNFKFKR